MTAASAAKKSRCYEHRLYHLSNAAIMHVCIYLVETSPRRAYIMWRFKARSEISPRSPFGAGDSLACSLGTVPAGDGKRRSRDIRVRGHHHQVADDEGCWWLAWWIFTAEHFRSIASSVLECRDVEHFSYLQGSSRSPRTLPCLINSATASIMLGLLTR